MTESRDDPRRRNTLNVVERRMSPGRPLSHAVETLLGFLLFHRREPTPDLIKRLRDEVRRECSTSDDSIEADALWVAKRNELRALLVTHDPHDFLRWDPIRATMVKRGRTSVKVELRHLKRRPDWSDRWRHALRESTLGRPRPFPRFPWSSSALIHLAYHACRFEEATGRPLDRYGFILEFGGGYGGMCRLAHDLGFRGEYWIYDLPEVTALQRFFLRTIGIHAENEDSRGGAVMTFSDPSRLCSALAKRRHAESAFIAAWSLGETPICLRNRILPAVSSFDAFFIGYTEQFGDIDNTAFFRTWRSSLSDHEWYDVPLPHLNKREWYLFGARPRLVL
jgi:hypothetical protein